MSDAFQLTMDGDEKPHSEVVKELRGPKRRAVAMAHIELIAAIIKEAEIEDADRFALAASFANVLMTFNNNLKYDAFMAMAGCE